MSATSIDTSIERLGAFCEANQLAWDAERADLFRQYIELLLHFNRAMNLIGPLGAAEIVDELLIDSLSAAAVAPPQNTAPGTSQGVDLPGESAPSAHLLDVGTGAGLPGIPLKLIYPELPVTLVEPRAKRTTFLKIAVERLALEQVTIARCRLEELAPGRFDYVISKAFRAPLKWLELAAEWVAPAGQIICMTRPEMHKDLERRAAELGLTPGARSLDVSALGAPVVGEKRAIFSFQSA